MLVISQEQDGEAELVAEVLADRGVDVAWFDTAHFPMSAGLTAWPADAARPGWLTVRGRRVDLTAVCSVYRRHPSRFGFPDDMSTPERQFAAIESTFGVGGVLAVQSWRWMDSPAAVADASFKPRQLRVAAACGLRVPRTLITTDSEQLLAFAAEAGGPERLVYKVLHSGIVTEEDKLKHVYTSRLTPTDLDRLRDDGLRLCPHLFQQWIDKDHDVRLTVAGKRCFAVAVHARTAQARVDWRSDYDNITYTRCDTPPDVRDGATRFLHELGLRFAAFDFAVDTAGRWWFLEANPAGRWGWLEEETGVPIAEAIADELLART